MNDGYLNWLNGRRTRAVKRYSAERPLLDLRSFLDGKVQASGAMFGPRGRAGFRFRVGMSGVWNGSVGTLSERFTYADGAETSRVWRITFADDCHFRVTAEDVVGEAVGCQAGNAAVMRYRLRVPRGRRDLVLSMEDWFFLMPDNVLLNRTRMSKFGLKVGELISAFRRCGDPAGDQE